MMPRPKLTPNPSVIVKKKQKASVVGVSDPELGI